MNVTIKWSLIIAVISLCFILINPSYAQHNYIRGVRQFNPILNAIGPRLYVEFESELNSYHSIQRLTPKALSLADDFLGSVEGRFEFRDISTGVVYYCSNARKVYSPTTYIGCLRGDMQQFSDYSIQGISHNVTSYLFKFNDSWLEADDSDVVVFVEVIDEEPEEGIPTEEIPEEDEPKEDEPKDDEPNDDDIPEDDDDPIDDSTSHEDCDHDTTEVTVENNNENNVDLNNDVDMNIDLDVTVDVNIEYDIDIPNSGSLTVDEVETDDSEVFEDNIMPDPFDPMEQISDLLGTGSFTGGACSLNQSIEKNGNPWSLAVLALFFLPLILWGMRKKRRASI